MVNNVEILPLQDSINLLSAEQPFQQPPLVNLLNNQGIDPNDGNDENGGNDGVEQVEDELMFSPFLMNVDPPQMIMEESPILLFQLQESPILPVQLHLPEV